MNLIETKKQDSATGETVYQVRPPDSILAYLDKTLTVHNEFMNQFMTLTQQMVAIQKKVSDIFDEKENAAKDVNNAVMNSIKKMKLDRNAKWAYNIADKSLERREPPTVGPLEAKSNP